MYVHVHTCTYIYIHVYGYAHNYLQYTCISIDELSLSVSLPVVQMPSDQYTLELSNTTVASLDKEMSRVTGMILGDTEIVLHDKSKNLKE